MIWFLAVALVVAVIAYLAFPGFRDLVAGWKTRLTVWVLGLGSIVNVLDPKQVSTALGLDDQGKAIVAIALVVLAALFHEATLRRAKK